MKHNTLVFPDITKYDVFQLKKAYTKNFSLGMTIAVLIHILLIGVYYFLQATSKIVESKSSGGIIIITEPPPINIPVDRPKAASSLNTRLKFAIPIPVPEDKVADEKLFPTQNDLSSSWTQTGDVNGGNVIKIPGNTTVETPKEEIPDMKKFIPYEKAPEIVELINPAYPELARRAGLEGTVYLNILIGKDGRPIKAVVFKFDSEIFVKPSVDAAMKSIFTPAIQHKTPIMVWIMIPFRFKINN